MNARDEGQNVDEIADPIARAAFRFFCRHLVAITGTYIAVDEHGNATDKQRAFVYTGFVVAIDDVWMIATAGHNLEDLMRKIDRIKLGPCHLVDHFGPAPISTLPIPFDLRNAEKFYIYKDDGLRLDGADLGLDFGLLLLNSNQVQLLKANTVEPVSALNMKTSANAKRNHIIIGFPECLQNQELLPNGRMAFDFQTAMAGVTELDPPPHEYQQTDFPRFVGRLLETVTMDIEGMSGGPIIGFSDDKTRYWVVAVQSKWLRDDKIVFGCPTATLLAIVEDGLERYQAEHLRASQADF